MLINIQSIFFEADARVLFRASAFFVQHKKRLIPNSRHKPIQTTAGLCSGTYTVAVIDACNRTEHFKRKDAPEDVYIWRAFYNKTESETGRVTLIR